MSGIKEQDKKRIELFKQFITVSSDADSIRKALTRVYMNYSRLLIRAASNDDTSFINHSIDDDLYTLSEIIEVLEGGF